MTPPAAAIALGTTFLWRNDLHVVISDPEAHPDRVVIVSFSRIRPDCDPSCLLEPGDHPFIRERTFVAYEWARNPSLATLQEYVRTGDCVLKEPASSELVARLIEGALASEEIPLAIQDEVRFQQLD